MKNKKKIMFITDSFCGYSKEKLLKDNIILIPHLIYLDDKKYAAGDGFSIDDLCAINPNSYTKALTSLPPVQQLSEIIEKGLEEYEKVIFLTMNENISGTYSSAKMLENSFENYHAINSNLTTGTATIDLIKEMRESFENGGDIDDMMKIVDFYQKNTKCYIIPLDLIRLEKSGRIKGAAKIIFKKLNLIPVLALRDLGIKVNGVKRSAKSAIGSIIDKLHEFNGVMANFELLQSNNKEINSIVDMKFKSIGIDNYLINNAPIAALVHTGPGSIGLSS